MDVKNIFMNSDIVCHIVIINREISWSQAYSYTFCYFFWQFGGGGEKLLQLLKYTSLLRQWSSLQEG